MTTNEPDYRNAMLCRNVPERFLDCFKAGLVGDVLMVWRSSHLLMAIPTAWGTIDHALNLMAARLCLDGHFGEADRAIRAIAGLSSLVSEVTYKPCQRIGASLWTDLWFIQGPFGTCHLYRHMGRWQVVLGPASVVVSCPHPVQALCHVLRDHPLIADTMGVDMDRVMDHMRAWSGWRDNFPIDAWETSI